MRKKQFKILFLDFSTHLQSINDLNTEARGGMVSSLFIISDQLAKRGHEVFVLADIKEDGKTSNGTIWCSKDGHCDLKGYDWDFLILNRGTGEGFSGIQAKHRILWTHDLPHNGFVSEPRIFNAFSGVIFMSRYAERIWRAFYKDIGKSFLIPNGIDKSLFYPREKSLNYLIFASAPNRGLRRLTLILDAIKTRLPDRHIFLHAYSNMAAMHPNESKFNDYAEDYNVIKESDVQLYDPLPQQSFANQLGQAGLMIMPSDYPEICSNVILQSLASGTPVITTGNLGSACEWIKSGWNGYLTDFHVHDYMIHTLQIVRAIVEILNNPAKHKDMIINAAKTNNLLSWDEIGSKWEVMLHRIC